MNDSSTPLRAADLHGTADSESDAAVAAEQGVAGTRVDAEVEVQVGAVLVGTGHAVLRAERVAVRRAQVGHLHHDALAGVGDLVAAAVGLDGELPASSASWACTGALISMLASLLVLRRR